MLAATLSFAAFAALLTITPGLDTMYVVRTAAVSGRAGGFAAAVGIGLGCLAWAAASGLGITALLTASDLAYLVLRIVGAVYLGYLGIRTLWRARRPSPDAAGQGGTQPTDGRVIPARSAGSAFRVGLLTNLLNPKVGVFYVAALPQFIPHGVNVLAASLWLGLVHDVEGMIWFAALILAIGRTAAWLRRDRVRRWLDRVTGTVFIGFGLKLALTRG